MTLLAEDKSIRLEGLRLGPYETNAYILVCKQTRESALVDAPAEADQLLSALAGTKPKYILLTHSHGDHIGALDEVRARLKIPLAMHRADARIIKTPPEILLNDGDELKFGKISINVLHTPGHTPGSLCFRASNFLLGGDTIFPGGPGHTNSPAAFGQIIQSLETRVFALDEEIRIYPGHGESTTVREARQEYAVFKSRKHGAELYGDVLWASS